MDRYTTNLKIINTDDGKRYFGSVVPVAMPTDPTFAITHYAGANDRLDTLAYKYYGTPSMWWVIAKANSLVNGTIRIRPGTKLVIPRLN